MLQAFVRLSLRYLFKRNRFFTFINIVGLSIGLTCLWVVALFVYDEYHFDNHYTQASRIYRVVVDFTSEGTVTRWAKSSAPIGEHLGQLFPEIESVVRIRKNPGTDLLSIGEKQFYEPNVFFADSTFFDVFDLPFIHGNARVALRTKSSIVITERLALKYFGSTDVLGNMIRYNQLLDFSITGVVSDMPPGSHFVADAFIPFSNLYQLLGEKRLSHWGQFDHYTYILLQRGASAPTLESKLPELFKRHAPDWVNEKESLSLQPLTAIHLHSDRKDEITPNSNENASRILGTIGLFILLIACANFINLSTATHLIRRREMALQKIMGAKPATLAGYLALESALICFCALILSAGLTQLVLPAFNFSTGRSLSLSGADWLLMPAIGITLLITCITAIFPTAQTGNLPLTHINNKVSIGAKSNLRTGLITFQFATSIFLMLAAWVIAKQVDFLQTSHDGFASDSVIVIPVKDRSQNDRFATITNEIEQLPGVMAASFSSSTPGVNNSLTYTYTIEGSELGEQAMATFIVDDKFLNLFEMRLSSGRNINPQSKDTLSDVLINQAAVKLFQLDNPIGRNVSGKVKGRIVGVVEDFNHTSLRESTQPLIIYRFIPSLRFVSVKLNNPSEGVPALEKKWPQLYQGYPLEYDYLNDQMEQLYGDETHLATAYSIFSVIAVLIASVGLIGLSASLTNRKLKEIGIRKVFGGSVIQILIWLYKNYTTTIVIATIIATVFGYYVMEQWLSNFSYRVELKLYYFILPPVIMTIVLLISTGFQSIRASLTNPAQILREN